MEDNLKFYVIIGLFAIVIILFGILVLGQKPTELNLNDNTLDDHTINVSGYAENKVSPDEAYIYFTIETTAKTAKEAQTENAKIWDNLKLELEGKDYLKYQTEGYNVWPKTEWDKNYSKSKVVGYVVSNRIKITLTKIEESGKILDLLVSSEINNVDTVTFGLSRERQESIKSELWKEAVDDAKNRAETVANATGANLNEIPKSISINNYNYSPTYRYYDYAMSEKAYGTDQAMNTEITPQELIVSVSLGLVYEYE